MVYKTNYGEYKISDIIIDQYQIGGNLAIELICMDEDGFEEPFARLTVNLDEELPENMAYVDTNNLPEAEEFIAKYKLGTSTFLYGESGFCSYPLYIFDVERLKSIIPDNLD